MPCIRLFALSCASTACAGDVSTKHAGSTRSALFASSPATQLSTVRPVIASPQAVSERQAPTLGRGAGSREPVARPRDARHRTDSATLRLRPRRRGCCGVGLSQRLRPGRPGCAPWRAARVRRAGSSAPRSWDTATHPPRTHATTVPPRSGIGHSERASLSSTALDAAVRAQTVPEQPPGAMRSGQRARRDSGRGAHAAEEPAPPDAPRTRAV